MIPARRRLKTKLSALLVAAGLLGVTGCSGEFEGIYDFPLPGGADLGDDPYKVTIEFADVLELVPRSGVQVNNVTVGNVTNIDLDKENWNAEVTVEVNNDVELPANSSAYVRQTALLGEKYIALEAPPESSAHGTLGDGDVIPIARTERSVEIEEILGALSMLLNGGGIEQINNITDELNKALDGNTAELRSFLRNADSLVTKLDKQSGNITEALDSLNQLSKTLNGQTGKIKNALDELGPGLKVLDNQRDKIVEMLGELRDLSTVAVDTIQQSKQDTIANLESLLPTLRKLAEAGGDLPKALEILLTFPFNDQAVSGVKGDYFNLYATLDLNLKHISENLGRSRQSILHSLPILGDLVPEQTGEGSSESEANDASLPLPETDSGKSTENSADNNGRSQDNKGQSPDEESRSQDNSGEQAPGTGIGGVFDRFTPGGDN